MLDWFTVVSVRILSIGLQGLPHEAALGLGRFIGFCLSKMNYRRRVAYANLKAAFPDQFSSKERKKIVEKHFIHLAQNIVEIFRFPKLNQTYLERYVQVEHRDRYEHHVQGGQGTVLITPHFGNWELTQILSGLVGKPMYVLAREQKHSRLNDYLNDLRASHGSVTIQKGGGVRELIRELKKGGFVGVLGDLSGGRSGIVVKFFGRKTTAPPGIFEIASRTNATILPCFMVRLGGPRHRVFIEEPFECLKTSKGEFDLQATIQNYYGLLEKWISDYPDQWLWIYKRWKYCFTKKILILKDMQAGHANQSEAIAGELEKLRESLPQEYELKFQSITVRFKSNWHRKLFFLFTFFALPFAQGRLSVLNFFFEAECAQELQKAYADLIVSAGSSLAPLNLLLKKENLGKSIVVMKPSFPFHSRFFDLLIVPVHDAFPKHKRGVVRTLITPSCVDRNLLQMSGGQLAERVSLALNGKKRISVFIGGKTKSYEFKQSAFRKWLLELKTCAEKSNFELLITTSRRTDPEISQLVKEELGAHPRTKLLVIASESNIENVVYGMLALSDIALVTEDSVSMISDAVSAEKKVIVLKLGNGKLPKKHYRFQEALRANALVSTADEVDFSSKLSALNGSQKGNGIQNQSRLIQEALRKLL